MNQCLAADPSGRQLFFESAAGNIDMQYSTVIKEEEMSVGSACLIPSLRAAPWHGSLLMVDEVSSAYDAVAYSMYKYGLMVNTHMTFEWNKLGVHRPDEAVKILSQFNSEMAKWLRVGKPRESIQRMGRRQGRSAEHFYVFAHENGGKHGLHTHQICFVPPATINAFRVWAWKRLGTLAKSFDPQNGALDITAWKTTT